jgi:hypothetical protein
MKQIIVVSILSIVISCTSGKTGQETDLAVKEKALVAAIEVFRTGVINADKDLLESISADKILYAHVNGRVQNKAEYIEEIVSLQPNDYTAVEMTEQTISIAGNTAVVRHIYSADFISNGADGNMRVGNFMIWQEQEGEWKLLLRQSYRL